MSIRASSSGTSVLIEPMLRADVQRCTELERTLFGGDDPWNSDAFLQALTEGHYYVVARVGDSLAGYAGLARIDTEAEVHTLAVDPAHQGQGIGRALLRALLDHATGTTVFLEVRTDNDAAIALYRSEGFAVIATRRGYYRPSGADAFTMRKKVPKRTPVERWHSAQ
ncbi:MAG: ribosomal protein S18-alanine N-acetyltransferase [Pseudonocardiaceae bacterium]